MNQNEELKLIAQMDQYLAGCTDVLDSIVADIAQARVVLERNGEEATTLLWQLTAKKLIAEFCDTGKSDHMASMFAIALIRLSRLPQEQKVED